MAKSRGLMKLSVIIIARNEAHNLKRALKSVTWADEVIVYDSGSTDSSREVVESFNRTFICNDTWLGYGPQRQKAQTYASGDWVFWLDADEEVTEALAEEIVSVIQLNNRQVIYSVPRKTWFFGRFIKHGGWYPDRVLRLHCRVCTQYDDALVHEKLCVPADTELKQLKGEIKHFSYKSIRQYMEKSVKYAEAWAEQRDKQGARASLMNAFAHALGCFVRMYFLRCGFMDGRQGFLLAVLSSISVFLKYSQLWVRCSDF